ncbi:predicted protein [Nematostella vectensis]|uniref:Uncharacterized protein n=1 Tax=Nematostella vectensis TaxID=45351 RepID=A7SK74_NEMVE|nr:predicted protein [Nematostella vectensis]|eukprot:XP_001627969.1 predicted protein [Nematostella vectensis]
MVGLADDSDDEKRIFKAGLRVKLQRKEAAKKPTSFQKGRLGASFNRQNSNPIPVIQNRQAGQVGASSSAIKTRGVRPGPFVGKNNSSAFKHASFVNEAIKELISNHCVEEITYKPEIINPLSVSVQSSGKKRLIIDLRHVNKSIYKQHMFIPYLIVLSFDRLYKLYKLYKDQAKMEIVRCGFEIFDGRLRFSNKGLLSPITSINNIGLDYFKKFPPKPKANS